MSKTYSLTNENGQAVLLVTLMLTAILASVMVPFLGGSFTHNKAQSTHVTLAQTVLTDASLSNLLSDGSNCAFAFMGQSISNSTNQVTISLPGDPSIGNSQTMISAGGTTSGLQVQSVVVTPTNWPGTPIQFAGNPQAFVIKATLQLTYGLNMKSNYGSSSIDSTPINLSLILNNRNSHQVIGCADPLVATCQSEARAINPVSQSPLSRQSCDQIVAQQIDNGDALNPSTMRCGISTKKDLYCWGGAVTGQSDPAQPQSQPALMSVFDHNVTQSSSGGGFSCSIAGFSVYCWGSNEFLEAGPGPNPIVAPTVIAGIPGTPTKIATAASTACAISYPTNHVYCWGYNNDGEAGVGFTSAYVAVPTDIGLTNVSDIVGRNENFCAIKTDGTLWCWGMNGGPGILENVGSYHGGPPLSPTPVQITGLAGPITSVAVGWSHACVILATGQVQCWGLNDGGQLGIGSQSFPGTGALPGPTVVGVTNAVQISAGMNYTCITDSSGAVKCWGAAQYGNMGSLPNEVSAAVLPGLSTGVSEVQVGAERTCARMTCGQVRCVGNNQFGNLGDGTTNNAVNPVVTKTFSGTGCPA